VIKNHAKNREATRMSRALRSLFADRQRLRDELAAIDGDMPDDIDLEAKSMERARSICERLRAIDSEIAISHPRSNKEALAIAIGPLLCAVVAGDDQLATALRAAVERKVHHRN
jgi:hypothetical protein